MEKFFIRQELEDEFLFPVEAVLLDQLGPQICEHLIVSNTAGAIHDTVFTKETGQDDFLEAFRKLNVAFQEISYKLNLAPRARSLHENLLVNGAGGDAEATFITAIDKLSCLLEFHSSTPEPA
jgi:hypothetical protein